MTLSISNLVRRVAPVVALGALVISMNGTWATAEPAPTPPPRTASAAGSTSGSARAAGPTAASGARSGARSAAPDAADEPAEARTKSRPARKEITGKLNLNTATEEQLMLLPTVGPSKAERIITWRKKNGGFKRIADLRRVKGFGYKTFKRLEPFLDITGETTLALKR